MQDTGYWPSLLLDAGKNIVDFINYMPAPSIASRRINGVRRFNRFYTRIIGALDEGHLATDYALAEVRLLFEIAHRPAPTATELVNDLGLDAGYVSRLIRGMTRRRLVRRRPSKSDGRQSYLELTPTGQRAVADLEARASADVARLLAPLDHKSQQSLVDAMERIQSLLSPAAPTESAAPYLLRTHQPGDMGWVVQVHGALYWREYGWDERFEALVARIVADFIEQLEPRRERCWIAERDGANVGSVFVVRHREREGVAKLRLLLVDPNARGLGIGRRLVDECIRFARAAGYHTLTLWTNDVLVAARKIYQAAGFSLVGEEPHTSFGHDLVSQTWELPLR